MGVVCDTILSACVLIKPLNEETVSGTLCHIHVLVHTSNSFCSIKSRTNCLAFYKTDHIVYH